MCVCILINKLHYKTRVLLRQQMSEIKIKIPENQVKRPKHEKKPKKLEEKKILEVSECVCELIGKGRSFTGGDRIVT